MDRQRSAQMTSDELLERRIERALAVEPPPEFVARVRTRIEREPTPSTWLVWWRPAAAGVLAITIAVALFITSSDRNTASRVSDPPVAASVSQPAPPATEAAPPPIRDVRVAPSARRTVAPRRSSRIVDERTALRLLITNIREGRIDAAELKDFEAPRFEPVREISIEPIEIAPVPQIAFHNTEPLPRPAALEGEQSW
jgi:hypothetical protein